MIKCIGTRGSGKTTRLLELADAKGYVLVEPTYAMALQVREWARMIGIKSVPVISAHEMFDYQYGVHPVHFLIDELDRFLEVMHVAGYSNTCEDSGRENDSTIL